MSKAYTVGRNTGRKKPSICLQGPGWAGRRAAATSGDLQFFQIWLQLTALHHQEPDNVGLLGSSGRTAGRSIMHINILVPEIIPWKELKMPLKYIQTLLVYIFWSALSIAQESALALSPLLTPCLGLGTLVPLFHLGTANNMADGDFVFFMEGGIWMCSFYRVPPTSLIIML